MVSGRMHYSLRIGVPLVGSEATSAVVCTVAALHTWSIGLSPLELNAATIARQGHHRARAVAFPF